MPPHFGILAITYQYAGGVMSAVFGLIAVFSYLFALLAFAVSKSDIQLIAAGIFATCGTVALVGMAVIARMPKPPHVPSQADTAI